MYVLSFLFLVSAVGFSIYNYVVNRSISLSVNNDLFIFAMTVIVASTLVALSKFCFTLGKSFMVESLRNSNRIHAISFGRFYLKVNKENIEWSDIKDAFQYWNIDSGSSFTSQSSKEYDPDVLSKIVEISKVINR